MHRYTEKGVIMIDTSTIQGKIAVMQAFADGKAIEVSPKRGNIWEKTNHPYWSWALNDYRIYEEPVILDEIPWDFVNPEYKYHAFDNDGKGYFLKYPPRLDSKEGYWYCDRHSHTSSSLVVIKRGNKPWDKSLVKRPEDV